MYCKHLRSQKMFTKCGIVALLLLLCCAAYSEESAFDFSPKNWMTLPGGIYINGNLITTDMKVLLKGQDLNIPVDIVSPAPNHLPDTPLKCCVEVLASVLTQDFKRYALVTAPKEERNPDGSVHSDYNPEPGPIGWQLLNMYIQPGWGKIIRYERLGRIHHFQFLVSSSIPPAKVAAATVWVEELIPKVFRNATFDYAMDAEHNLSHLFEIPENPELTISKIEARKNEFQDGVDGSALKEHEIVLSNIYGDTKNEFPIRIQFRGGVVQENGPYIKLVQNYKTLRESFEKLPNENTFGGPEWQACLNFVDENSQKRMEKNKENLLANGNTLEFFVIQMQQSFKGSIVYIIDLGPLYLCFAKAEDAADDKFEMHKFLKSPDGYKLINYKMSSSFDSLITKGPFWAQLLPIMQKEISEAK